MKPTETSWTKAPIRAVVAVGEYGPSVLWAEGLADLVALCVENSGDLWYAGLGSPPERASGQVVQGLWLWCSSAPLPEPAAGTPEYSAWMACGFKEPHWSRPTYRQARAIAAGDWAAL